MLAVPLFSSTCRFGLSGDHNRDISDYFVRHNDALRWFLTCPVWGDRTFLHAKVQRFDTRFTRIFHAQVCCPFR